jgi:Flp pilus assembly pilin Flp
MNIQPHRSWPGVTSPRGFLKDVRGSLTVEYVVLVGVVGLVIAATFIQVGPSILNLYQPTRSTLTAPVP